MKNRTMRLAAVAAAAMLLAAPAMAKSDHSDNGNHFGQNTTSVPEPASLALLGGGAALLVAMGLRGRKKD